MALCGEFMDFELLPALVSAHTRASRDGSVSPPAGLVDGLAFDSRRVYACPVEVARQVIPASRQRLRRWRDGPRRASSGGVKAAAALRMGVAWLVLLSGAPASAGITPGEFHQGSFASVPFLPSAADEARQGFVRIINHSHVEGTVRIVARDGAGALHGPVTLRLSAAETAHFNSDDLEVGNEAKGLSGGVGEGAGDWHLDIRSPLNIEVLAYVRTHDGFLTAMHDVVERAGDGSHRVATFNPASNTNQVSLLRVVNAEDRDVEVRIRGIDDLGAPSAADVRIVLAGNQARTIAAQELEAGGESIEGALGDGTGKWQLAVSASWADGADGPAPRTLVMSLLRSPTGHVTNLSSAPSRRGSDVHHVPFFPSAAGGSQRQGFLRVINHSDRPGDVRIRAWDDAGRDYGESVLRIAARRTVHFNSQDLEMGNAAKGLPKGTSTGDGDWRLELSGDGLDIEVLAYMRAAGGFLTAIHDVVPQAGNRYRAAAFNPGSNYAQVSVLRIANPGAADAEVVIKGIDGRRDAPGTDLALTVPAGAARSFTAAELEAGTPDFDGALGDGHGKWQLLVVSETPVHVMSLLESPTGHLTNLSTAPASHGYRDEFPGSPLMHVHNDNVLVLHVAGDAATITHPSPGHTTPVYEWFEDAFDFLILLPNIDSWFSASGVAGSYTAVMNNVAGLGGGRGIFHDNRYGSGGRLRGVIHMNNSRLLLYGPTLHELQHAWANFTVPTTNPSHWGFSSANGQLGGFNRNDLVALGDGRYAAGAGWRPNENGGNTLPYSPIELYLAGYAAPQSVPDLWVAADGQWLVEDGARVRTDDGEPVFTATDVVELTIDDIVAEHGLRNPGAGAARKDFRAAVVLLVDERQPLFADDLAVVSEHARIFSHPGDVGFRYCQRFDPGERFSYIRACDAGIRLYNYYEATGGAGTITMAGLSAFRRPEAVPTALPDSVGLPPLPTSCTSTAEPLAQSREDSRKAAPTLQTSGLRNPRKAPKFLIPPQSGAR